MSMIRCARCDRYLDAKDEGIDGIYGKTTPFEYICPSCVDRIASMNGIEDLEYQDQRIINAYRWNVIVREGL